MKAYLEKINAFIAHLDTATLAALENVTVEKQFRKGDYLLQQDEICRYSFLIIKGVARKFYLQNGKEITTELFFTEDLAVSFRSYTLQNPSHEFIQALENITVTVTDYTAFQKAKNAFPKLVTLDLMMTEYYTMWLEERLFEFHSLDATQRYLKLLNEHPHILQSVQLTHIASYLGISLETLSRIRAKI